MTAREPPRPATRYASTLVGVEENGNGHGPQTDRPRPLADLPRQELAEDTARQIGLLDGKVDALQEDMREVVREGREASKWRKTVDSRLGALELGVFEILGLVKRAEERADEAKGEAARAGREAKAAKDESVRASQTNEIAVEHTKQTLALVTKEHDVELEEKKTKAVERAKRNAAIRKVVSKVAEHGLSVAVGGIIMALLAWKGCHP